MFSEKELYILNWIKEVSQVREELNGFAICPFASNSKFKIIECSVEKYKLLRVSVIIFIVETILTSMPSIFGWIIIT